MSRMTEFSVSPAQTDTNPTLPYLPRPQAPAERWVDSEAQPGPTPPSRSFGFDQAPRGIYTRTLRIARREARAGVFAGEQERQGHQDGQIGWPHPDRGKNKIKYI